MRITSAFRLGSGGVLSILYLRCTDVETYEAVPEPEPFNSLFEMLALRAAVDLYFGCAFNSLFEMQSTIC